MLIFGSIGIFVRNITWSSASVAMIRAVIGTVFLLLLKKQKISLSAFRKYLPVLIISGAALGFNWILLFESYKYTSVAVSTLCYYTAPILVILLSPLVLKEKLTPRKIGCVVVALIGMVFVSGILGSDMRERDTLGIVLGLGAAVLYATVVMLNKKQKDIPSFDRTLLQLGIAAIVLIPYNLSTHSVPSTVPDITTALLLLTVGIVHTGLAYYLYFSSMEHLPGQTMAIISYVDPMVAVMASALILHEPTTWQELLGAVLILGAALISELTFKRKGQKA